MSDEFICGSEIELCKDCGEPISNDDAVMHYHAGTVISLEEKSNA